MRSLIMYFAVAALAFACAQEGAAAEKGRPNILFVFADDWGYQSGSYSAIDTHAPWNKFAETPNFDRIAREGVLFRNAFVSAPQCTPSRSALLSGRNFWQTGLAAVQEGIWDFTLPSFPMLLRDAGYHAGYTSKVWSPGTPKDGPFGGTQYKYEQAGTEYDAFSTNVYKHLEQGMSVEQAKQAIYAQVRGNLERFLKDRKAGQPFFYWFGGRSPHRSWIKGSGKKLWGIDPERLKGKMPPFLPDTPEVREDLADYFGECRAFDACFGVLLEKLKEICELDNTLIVDTGDNGSPGFTYGKCNLYDLGTRVCLAIRYPGNPKPGRVVDDFVNLMDLAPTLLDVAGVDIPRGMTGRSLMPQLSSSRAGQIDPGRTWVATGRERHVPKARSGDLPYPQRAYRTEDFLYIINFKPDRWPCGDPKPAATPAPDLKALENDVFCAFPDMDQGPTKAFLVTRGEEPEYARYFQLSFAKRPEEELYDLRKDPSQMVNVAADPAYQTKKAELHSKLMKVLKETGDPRVMGDGSRFDKLPYTFQKWSYKED